MARHYRHSGNYLIGAYVVTLAVFIFAAWWMSGGCR